MFWVASDESQVVWRLFNMTHILQTNSKTAGPVARSKNTKPLKRWLTSFKRTFLCVMEMLAARIAVLGCFQWSALGEKTASWSWRAAPLWRASLCYYRCYCSARATTIWARLANTWPRLALCLRRDRGEINYDPSTPAGSQVFTRLSASFVHKYRQKESKNLTGKEKTNKQKEQVVGVTYRVPLAFPSFHAFPGAL